MSGSNHPACEKSSFSTWSEVAKASTAGDLPFISMGIFCRSCCSGTTWYSTWIPVSFAKSGTIFWSTV